jgi:hypothetical protein
MLASKASALSKFVTEVKGGDKAKLSISKTLEKIIEDYCVSGEFDAWLEKHYSDAAKYLQPQHNAPRQGVFRASAAGKCIQQQCFKIVHEPETDVVTRPGRQNRALYNGTFSHARWHMLFDALHEKGLVITVAAEELRYDPALELSGTIDRVIELVFNGKTVRIVLDFKTIKRQYFEALYGPQADHTQQQHAYDFLKWGADVWIMMYECKDSHDLKIYDKPYDPEVLIDIREKYALALKWTDIYEENRKQGEHWLHKEALPKLELNTDWCQYCPWQKRCAELNGKRKTK